MDKRSWGISKFRDSGSFENKSRNDQKEEYSIFMTFYNLIVYYDVYLLKGLYLGKKHQNLKIWVEIINV